MTEIVLEGETERLALEVAALTGERPEQAVHAALAESLARERRRMSILAIIERAAAQPVVDNRSEDEILGYDEHGLPR